VIGRGLRREKSEGMSEQGIAERVLVVNNQNRDRNPDQLDRMVDVLLEEFRIVTGEIANRSQSQYALLNIAIVGAGATAAYVLGFQHRAIFALALSFFSSFLGAMWLDHARVITSKGIYISSNLWPRLRERLKAWDLTSHEDWTRRQEADRAARLLFVIPVMGVFVLPAIAGLIYSFSSISTPVSWIAWALGSVTTALSVAYWVAFYLDRTVLAYVGPPYQSPRPGPGFGPQIAFGHQARAVAKLFSSLRDYRS
jgi:hypothetical protein